MENINDSSGILSGSPMGNTGLIEVSREYKTPLCLTFIDLKKAFDSVETEAVIEALCKQGVSTQYVKILSELYNGFTTVITPSYNNVRINVKKSARQGDTIPRSSTPQRLKIEHSKMTGG
ncbi:hypothetical protein Q1695_011567 [Nippostrongylus brasiliensis]|nr:hypothetical protein Q1695_011567 [Nippostrongylus brasiliensis]